MPRRSILALLAAAGLATGAVACSSADGRQLPPPQVLQTTTSSTGGTSIGQPPVGSVDVFSLASPSFQGGGELPVDLTCRGEGLSPALAWTGTPLEASSLALVVRDLDAGGFVHWVVTGIDPFLLGMGEGGLPENAMEGRNSAGTIGWIPPCPQAGTGVHTYELTLLALDEPVAVDADTLAVDAAAALEAAALGRAVLTGTADGG